MYACICHGITERALREAIASARLDSVHQIRTTTGATGCCGSCHEQVAFILDDERLCVADANLNGPHPVRLATAVA